MPLSMQTYLNPRTPCICIPRLPKETTKEDIADVFRRLDWGNVQNIIIVTNQKKQQERDFVCVFVHLVWKKNATYEIRQKLLNKESIKVVCGEYEFWKLYAKKNN
jgi:hypothetical protein